MKSAFWLTSDSEADDVVLGTATLAGGGGDGGGVVSMDTGGLDGATAAGGGVATEATLVLVVLVDVSDEDELLLELLELELLLLLLELEVELELALDNCALTALASFEMFEWHCAVIFFGWSDKTVISWQVTTKTHCFGCHNPTP